MDARSLPRLLAPAGLMLALACTEPSSPVFSVQLLPAADTIRPGAVLQLEATALDRAGHPLYGPRIAWRSSDPAVASVTSGGVLTGAAEGVVTITATVDDRSASASITVRARVASVFIVLPADSLVAGDAVRVAAVPLDSLNQSLAGPRFLARSVTWRTDDTTRATITSDGILTAHATGAVVVTATIEGIAGSGALRVLVRAASLTVTPPSDTVAPGETLALVAVLRDGAGNSIPGRQVYWLSSDPSRAVVFDAVVRGMSEGTATISAIAEGLVSTAAVTVRYTVVAMDIAPDIDSVSVGDTLALIATPRDPQGRPIPGRTPVWQSLDPVRATVTANGVVHANAMGAVDFTATVEGVTGRGTVVILSRVASVTLTPPSANLLGGDSVQLTVTLRDPAGQIVTDHPVNWSSDDPQVASVSSAGLVHALHPGTARITASAGGQSATVVINVSAGPPAQVDGEWSFSHDLWDYYGYSQQCGDEGSLFLTQAGTTLAGSAVSDGSCYPVATRFVTASMVSGTQVTFTLDRCSITLTADPMPRADSLLGWLYCDAPWYGYGSFVARRAGLPASLMVPTMTIQAGHWAVLSTVLRDAAGNRLFGRPVTWSSSNTAVAGVTPAGVLTGLQPGSVTITAVSSGLTATATIQVTP